MWPGATTELSKNGAWTQVGRAQAPLVCSLPISLDLGSNPLSSLLVLSLSEHGKLGNLEKNNFLTKLRRQRAMEKSIMRNWTLLKRSVVIHDYIYFCIPINCSLLSALHYTTCFPYAISVPSHSNSVGEGNNFLNFIEEEMRFREDLVHFSTAPIICESAPVPLHSPDPCWSDERMVRDNSVPNLRGLSW